MSDLPDGGVGGTALGHDGTDRLAHQTPRSWSAAGSGRYSET